MKKSYTWKEFLGEYRNTPVKEFKVKVQNPIITKCQLRIKKKLRIVLMQS
jgi:hypothetical protein